MKEKFHWMKRTVVENLLPLLLSMPLMLTLTSIITSCDNDDKQEIEQNNDKSYMIDFEKVPSSMMVTDKYGENLYSSSNNQYTTGYIEQVGESDIYVQFAVNYSNGFDFWNGGIAISSFTDKEDGEYTNQCSVYNSKDGRGGKSGSKFALSYGNSTQEDFDGCGQIRVTDKIGFSVVDSVFSGVARYAKFNSIWVCNTTYTFLTMDKGNAFSSPLKEKKGWFKVIFTALDEEGKTTGKTVSYYLANFDEKREQEAGILGVREGWSKVALTDLGEQVCTVAISFEGSDVGEWGLNTPTYVALDDLSVSIK